MNENGRVTVHYTFHRACPSKRVRIREGAAPAPPPEGSVPRIARLLALAHHYNGLIERGEVAGYAELARLTRVTRARITQVMNLLYLAPDIQEEILDLPRTKKGDDPICERQLRKIVRVVEWDQQRAAWR
ncbi:hypothetical protein HY251_00125, partial [bacterium]|nr:hypothetical protein [bacterium]